MTEAPALVVASGTFDDLSIERAHLGPRATIRLASLASPDDVRLATVGANAVVVTNNPLTASHIDGLSESVRVIGRAGIGLDAIDLDAAVARGIAVVHVPDYATNEVATHAVAMLLAVHRRLLAADAVARAQWTEWRGIGSIRPIEECTIGVVGCGRIGTAVIARLQPFAGAIVAYDPLVQQSGLGVTHAPNLDDLLSASDAVSLHLPLLPQTAGIIGARELQLLRAGAIFVNVSRGGLVDEAALADALVSGHLGGAALDVLAQEPPDQTSPIMRAPNTILSPHFGWYSVSSERRARTMVLDAILETLSGRSVTSGRLAVAPAS